MDPNQFACALADTLRLNSVPAMSDRLVEDVQLDSLDLLELWVGLEYAVERDLDPGAIEELVTVEDVYFLWKSLTGSD